MQRSLRNCLAAIAVSSTALFLASPSVFAAGEGEGGGEMPVGKGTPAITIQQAAGDTLQMTCAQGRAMVKGKSGVILKTGATHFDRYHRRGEACERTDQEMQPAFVRSKDNPLCFIGYTCETPESE